jgi:hypothetical protein
MLLKHTRVKSIMCMAWVLCSVGRDYCYYFDACDKAHALLFIDATTYSLFKTNFSLNIIIDGWNICLIFNNLHASNVNISMEFSINCHWCKLFCQIILCLLCSTFLIHASDEDQQYCQRNFDVSNRTIIKVS